MRSSIHRNPSTTTDRFADFGGTLVGACALLFLLCWYLSHLLP
ncbi:MAG: hypothetical protein QOF60_2181 [Actinomycetota bacterium]|jgi:hypothetical protein|nr:hypothetical protein [Actinomycetota bacterium]